MMSASPNLLSLSIAKLHYNSTLSDGLITCAMFSTTVNHAAMRADAMLDKGDLDGCAVWKRILWAVEELQGEKPEAGARVH